MVKDTDVVVIGSGGFGAATAYFLMRRGGRRVGPARPACAGLADLAARRRQRRHAALDDLMSRLARRAVEWLLRLSADTGEPLEIVRSGSLKAARTAEDRGDPRARGDRGERLGLGTRVVSPEAAHRMHPFFPARRRAGRAPHAGDVYFEPSHVASAYATAAGQARRDSSCPTPRSPASTCATGAWRGVETDRGRIDEPDRGSTRRVPGRDQVAAAAGIHVPMVAHAPPGAHHGAGRGGEAGAADRAESWMPRSTCGPCWGASSPAATRRSPRSSTWSVPPSSFSDRGHPARPSSAASRLMEGVREQLPRPLDGAVATPPGGHSRR
jgi:hypothetical protein